MKRIASLMMATAILCVTMQAQTLNKYDKYYTDLPIEIEHVQPVQFPALTVLLTDYGAVPGGDSLCTAAFDAAIRDLNKRGGGHLIVPKGVWKTGPIQLRSNVNLHLKRGATILFSENKELYVQPNDPRDGSKKCYALIRASKCENIGITGQGTIDGQGFYWRPIKEKKVVRDGKLPEVWDAALAMGGTLRQDDKTYRLWYPFNLNNGIPNIAATPEIQEKMRPHLVNITDSKNVVVQGITLRNSPKFHLVPTRIQNLIIEDVTIDCPWWAQNGDAMDPGNVQVALIAGCHISAGDDGICMKGGVGEKGVAAGPQRDFLICNDTVYRAHGGFVIGSEFSGGMQRIIVKDCMFDGTDIGCRFKSAPGRGGQCEDIYCVNITMKNIREAAILFLSEYADRSAGGRGATDMDDKSKFYPEWSNIAFRNIICANARKALDVTGMKGLPVHNIRFDAVNFYGVREGMTIDYAEDFIFNNCLITPQKENSIKHSKNLLWNGKPLE
ncbi:MAG: glycoside hydrolase family 28 protein [Paludibacteraceae bacterium]|nr:glycoside hydrolase family 28 protein [Paludibacteraceae bacterium]MBR1480748.1 glycoside hydrolase family 28 protein [Paludibacteraceae bacterium]